MRRAISGCILLILILAVGCAAQETVPAVVPTGVVLSPTTGILSPTLSPATPIPLSLCIQLDEAWGKGDWPQVVTVLEEMRASMQQCEGVNTAEKLYAARYNHGYVLEGENRWEEAAEQYRQALAVNSDGSEARVGLERITRLTPTVPPPTCTPLPAPAAIAPSATLTPQEIKFVYIVADSLMLDGEPFLIRGVNYYPKSAPWKKFLLSYDSAVVDRELELLQSARLNTLRIFLWYEPLFTCTAEEARPVEEVFAHLDNFIELSRERGFHLIVTLNDLPDLVERPLYTDWARYDAQTAYIVQRYKNEPIIIAWDVRNEGDWDYDPESSGQVKFDRQLVLDWLQHTCELVRTNDSNHLITAGWWRHVEDTVPYVDFLSIHHWADRDTLARRVDELRALSAKPILLEEFGYHSWTNAPGGGRDEKEQARLVVEQISASDEKGLIGWLVWAAFDFPLEATCDIPGCRSEESPEHHMGLWRTDYSPKPAVEAVLNAAQ